MSFEDEVIQETTAAEEEEEEEEEELAVVAAATAAAAVTDIEDSEGLDLMTRWGQCSQFCARPPTWDERPNYIVSKDGFVTAMRTGFQRRLQRN